eukprot:PhF_6_TR21077/c0_g1_i2/m.30376
MNLLGHAMSSAFGSDEKILLSKCLHYMETLTPLHTIYTEEAARFGHKKPNSAVVHVLMGQNQQPNSNETIKVISFAHYTGLTELNLNMNALGTLAALQCVLVISTQLKCLFLKHNNLANSDCHVLNLALRHHPSITSIDLSKNEDIGGDGGRALLQLLRCNRNISTCRVDQTSIPKAQVAVIQKEAATNFHSSRLTRYDYEVMHQIFKDLDDDRSGTVSLAELLGHENTKQKQFGELLQMKSREEFAAYNAFVKESASRYEARCREVFRKSGKDIRSGVSFSEYVHMCYPHIPLMAIEVDIEKYKKEIADEEDKGRRIGASSPKPSNAIIKSFAEEEAETLEALYLTLPQIIKLFWKYDVNGDGWITVGELAKGVDIEEKMAYSVLKDFDLNHDDRLCLDEFIAYCSYDDVKVKGQGSTKPVDKKANKK